MISVLVADDHPFVREALVSILQKEGDLQIVATASNGQEAVTQAILHCPNVAILDVSMPIMDGIEATKQIHIYCPQTRILIVSMHYNTKYIRRCLRAGAVGYVLKDLAGDELVKGVRSLHEGKQYFSEPITEIANYYLQKQASDFNHKTEIREAVEDGLSNGGTFTDA